jgi:hypothetical protein
MGISLIYDPDCGQNIPRRYHTVLYPRTDDFTVSPLHGVPFESRHKQFWKVQFRHSSKRNSLDIPCHNLLF